MGIVQHRDLEIVSLSHAPSAIGKMIICHLEIKNTGNVPYCDLVAVFEATGYICRSTAKVPTIKPFSRVTLRIEVDVKASATVDDLENRMPVRLQDGTGSVLCRKNFVDDSMYWYRKTITDMSTGFPCNILIFGMAGMHT
jgi:hypothetical protein